MKLHIGKEIRKRMQSKGWSIAVFAEKLNKPYRTVQYLLDRQDVSVAELLDVSNVLEFNFFTLLKMNSEAASKFEEEFEEYKVLPEGFITMSMTLQIAGRESGFAEFPKLLKATREYAKGLGFKVL